MVKLGRMYPAEQQNMQGRKPEMDCN